MTTIIRKNAEEHTLRVHNENGTQVWDLSKLNNNQLSGVREMVVNDWCRRNGFAPLYGE